MHPTIFRTDRGVELKPPISGLKMKMNVWNIKDLFSVPPGTGTSKSSGKNSNGEHSSLTDSQFLFSSQVYPDNSQPSPSDFRPSQHNSQDIESSVLLKYQSKPSLFSDGKDKGLFKSFGPGKNKGLMEQFEESKKKAKEKLEIDHLNNLMSSVQQTVQEIKMAFCQTEENTDLRCKAILESMEAVAKAVQDNAASNCESILKALSAKCDMEEALLDLEKKVHTNDGEFATMKCKVELLLSNMDALKSQQCEQQVRLSEKLGWLSDYMKSSESKILCELEKMNVPKTVLNIKDNTTQTSPATLANVSLKDHVEQLEPKETGTGASLNSQTSGRCTCNVSVSTDRGENISLSETMAAQKSSNLRCMNYIKNLPAGSEFSNILWKGPQQLNIAYLDQSQLLSIEKENIMDPGKAKENDPNASNFQDGMIETIGSSCVEENRLPKNKARKPARCRKRGTANRNKIFSKRKKSKCTTKSNRDTVSGNLTRTSQVKYGNKPVSSERQDSLSDFQQESIALLSRSSVASLPVIHAPMRKAQKKVKEKCSLLSSHQIVQQQASSKTQSPSYSSRADRYNRETAHWGFSTQESDMSQYTIKLQYPNSWLCPSSPLLDNNQDSPVWQEDNDVLSLFFDSSDENN
uniref:Interactor of HORMAD1 protein 1 n=1 Tax=Leptobrachium leishanense TaxID=445787 RepID=A0A8C5WJL3_9ANUR